MRCDCREIRFAASLRSRLRPLSIVDYERMTPAQLQWREAGNEGAGAPDMGRRTTASDAGTADVRSELRGEARRDPVRGNASPRIGSSRPAVRIARPRSAG